MPIGCEMSGQPETSDRCGVDVLTLDTAGAGDQCSATTLTSLSSLGICGTHVPAFRYTSWLDLNSNTANICQSPTCRELQFFNFSLTLGIRNDVQNDIIPYVPSVFLLQVRTGNTGHRLWRDYDVANLSVSFVLYPIGTLLAHRVEYLSLIRGAGLHVINIFIILVNTFHIYTCTTK